MREKVKRYKIRLIVIFALVSAAVSAVIIISLHGDHASAGETMKKQSTVSLRRMDLTKSVSATGTVQSKKTKLVSAQVNGIRVKAVEASVGDEVKKGDVLLKFDESDLQDALSEAEETLRDARKEGDKSLSSAKRQLSEAKDTYRKEKKKLESQVSKAKKERDNVQKQVSRLKQQILSEKNAEVKAEQKEQLTRAEESLKQAESAYETAVADQEKTNKQNKSNIENAQDAVDNAESSRKKNIKEAKKQVNQAEENLEKCFVTAPCGGIITGSTAEEGDVYSGGDLFQIDDNSSYIISTSVDEYDISDVSVGQRVVILTEATGEDEIEGEITFVAPSTGSTSLSSGSSQSGDGGEMSASSTSSADGYEVKVKVKTADERLRMGLTAKCSIILQQADDVYAVPYDAVQEKPDGTMAIHISEGGGESSSREIPVTKGMESDYYVEIQGSGLEEGLSVIIPTDEVSVSDDGTQDEKVFDIPGGSGAEGNGREAPIGAGRAPGGIGEGYGRKR